MSTIQINQLGLAAYVKMHGDPLVKVENKTFFFESEKSAAQWRQEYMNSESMRHDSLVCEMRVFMKSP